MARPCSLCRAFPGTEKREDAAVCPDCARKLDAMPFDRALKVLKEAS